MHDLIERLSNAIDKALAETEEGPASSSTTLSPGRYRRSCEIGNAPVGWVDRA